MASGTVWGQEALELHDDGGVELGLECKLLPQVTLPSPWESAELPAESASELQAERAQLRRPPASSGPASCFARGPAAPGVPLRPAL